MFANNKLRSSESMDLYDSSNDTINLTDINNIKYTTPLIINNDDYDENIWENVKSFFTPQNSMIVLAIICLLFFLITLCLVFIIIQLIKKKRLYKNQTKSIPNNYSKLEHHLNFPSSPVQMGLTSNQIASLGNILPINKESTPITVGLNSIHDDNNKTQSFENFDNEFKRTGLTSSNTTAAITTTNDDDIETVNEVLAMEERNGKIYYKVNFTGHPTDYTAWVCEEDLIPE